MSNPEDLKLSDDYLCLDSKTLSKPNGEYQNLNNKQRQDLIYHEISDHKSGHFQPEYEDTVKASAPYVNIHNDTNRL